MKKIEELQLELRVLDNKLQTFLEKMETPEGVTDAEIKEADSWGVQVTELTEKIEQLRRIESASEGVREPTSEPAGRGQPSTGQMAFNSFGEYLQAVAAAGLPRGGRLGKFQTGMVDRRLYYEEETEQRSTGLEEATPALGGFLVQTDFASSIWKLTHDTSLLFQRVNKIPISGNANGLKMNAIDETSRANGSRWGGILGYWLEEGGTKTASKPKFRQMELSLKKLIGLCYATDELLQDAAALEAVIRQGFAEEISFKIDDAIINGTGAGQPLGILNAAALISVPIETGQAASTIVWENIKKMYARLWARSRSNMVWVANQDCIPELMGMSQAVGTGGVPVWQPGNSAANRPYDQLLGRPIIYHEGCQTVGTAGDIYLIDPTQYLMITKGGVQSASSIHVQFTTDETTFRFVYRVDGQPLWSSALTPFKGSNTQSPYINLAVRS
jgi:HK97 family phage major capsid protein